jgi:hypothetical protein
MQAAGDHQVSATLLPLCNTFVPRF